MGTVDPGSDAARRRREAMGRGGAAEARAVRAFAPYAVATCMFAVTLAALAWLRPEWATSYAALTAALAALPFLHTVIVGVVTGGQAVPRPFGLRPIATVLVSTALFAAAVVAAPDMAAKLGGAMLGMIGGLAVLAVLLRMALNALR